MTRKNIPVEEAFAKWRQDPAYVAAYDALEEEFALAEALIKARAITPADGIILATGSIYLVGAIRTLALNGGANPA